MIKKIGIFILALIILTMPVISLADTAAEYKEKKEEKENEQKAVQAEKSALMQSIEELSNSIEDNEDKLADINAEITKLNNEIAQLEEEIKEAEKKYNEQEAALKEKLIIGYEMGTTTYLDVLLNSKGVLDFLSNYYIISEILQNDNDMLDSIEEQKNKIEKDKALVEEKQKEAKTQKAEQEALNVTLTNQKTQKQNKASQLTAEEQALQKQIDEYDTLMRQAEAEARKIAQKSTGVYVGGNKVWPCTGYYTISSGFGSRNTGIPGASTNHKGIDIGCPVGTKVVATLSGKVIFEGFNSARGYYMMVDHGGGVVSLYQHLKSGGFAVSTGASVSAGECIAYSGNTGVGSGPHLHFEVLINGVNVNPANWLKEG